MTPPPSQFDAGPRAGLETSQLVSRRSLARSPYLRVLVSSGHLQHLEPPAPCRNFGCGPAPYSGPQLCRPDLVVRACLKISNDILLLIGQGRRLVPAAFAVLARFGHSRGWYAANHSTILVLISPPIVRLRSEDFRASRCPRGRPR